MQTDINMRGCNASAEAATDTTANIADVADYIAELTDELSHLAVAKNLVFLASLLNLAKMEAKRVSDSASPFMQ